MGQVLEFSMSNDFVLTIKNNTPPPPEELNEADETKADVEAVTAE